MHNNALRIAPKPATRTSTIDVSGPVRDVKPYQAVSSLDDIHARPGQVPLKLDWNEATVPPSPRVIAAISAFLGNTHHLNWYPVLNSTNLIDRLHQFHDVDAGRLLITNGSDDALDTLCKTYLGEGDAVLVPSPTYQHFLVFAESRGARILRHYGPDPFEADLTGLLRALIASRPRMLYLVNPNNPTGVMYDVDQVATLLAAAPQTLVVVDEAYSEFSGHSCIELLHRYSNLVITRTFSKAYAMAGLRIGYAMADEAVITDLRRVFNPKSVNVLAQIGAMAALEDQDYLARYVADVNQSKGLIEAYCAGRGIPFRNTPANYVNLRFDAAPWVVRALAEAGVYVRDRSSMEQMGGYVRFSVGTPAQTHDLLDRLDHVLRALDGVG